MTVRNAGGEEVRRRGEEEARRREKARKRLIKAKHYEEPRNLGIPEKSKSRGPG